MLSGACTYISLVLILTDYCGTCAGKIDIK